jgi:hypothetical protein
LLSRALKGEDIGIICQGQVVALRPVKVYSDYALTEYGLTREEVDRSGKKLMRQVQRELKSGKLKKLV